ncbi:MAG TPA: hypothetical protein VFM31_06550 [Nitrososphaeraceae archaeon]|nr:hypothetical protein [Nitrososphaeraceae archaeon]
MSDLLFNKDKINLAELRQCPLILTIHSIKKITMLEKTAKYNLNLLPALDVAILPNNQKYLVKNYSVYEALQRLGIRQFDANCHFVNNFTEMLILHARLVQSDPLNPVSILELRDKLMKLGYDEEKIAKVCCLDPIHEKLLTCTLSTEARNQLNYFLDLLSQKLSRVNMPTYIIEIVSKRPLEIQADIIKSIFASIIDVAILNDRDFAFPNQDQVRMYADLHKKSEIKNGVLFEKEPNTTEFKKINSRFTSGKNKSESENQNIVENSRHLAIIIIGKKKFRINWKNKTFSEIKQNENFITLQNPQQLENQYVLSPKMIKFLGFNQDGKIYCKPVVSSKQLVDISSNLDPDLKFNGLIIMNKDVL